MNNNRFEYKILCCLLLFFVVTISTFAQGSTKKTKSKPVEVNVHVVDEQENPLPEVEIVVGEGLVHAQTNIDGRFSFKARVTDYVTISEQGYEKQTLSVADLLKDETVVLTASLIFKSEDDKIVFPFNISTHKREASGDYFVLTGKDLAKYPSLDLRNVLVGLVPGLMVTEMDGSTAISAEEERRDFKMTDKITFSMRGKSRLLFVVDDVPMSIPEMPLNPEEIETITFVRDIVGKTMYGPLGANGIIYIKTKRGVRNERVINVNVESGLSTIDRFPEFVSGPDYARLNNMARQNSGLSPLYSEEDIAKYANNNPYDKLHPNVNYKEIMFKNTRNYNRFNLSSFGGGDFVKYFAYLGYSNEGDNFKIGSKADYNRLNARTNIDLKVNDFIDIQFNIMGNLTLRNSPNFVFGHHADYFYVQNFIPALHSSISTPPNAFPIYAKEPEEDSGKPAFAVSEKFTNNPIGALLGNGYNTETGRLGQINVALNYNLSHLVPGLKSRTFINFNSFTSTRTGKEERYAGYTIQPPLEYSDEFIYKLRVEPISASAEATMNNFFFQRISGYQQFSYDRSFGDHHLQSSLVYNISKFTRARVENPLCEQNTNLHLAYSYDNKYAIQAALSYAGTQGLIGSNQYKLFPSLGASWIVSEENFMKELKFVDFFKLRAEYGVLGVISPIQSLLLYENKWITGTSTKFGPHSQNKWMGNQGQSIPYSTYYNKWGNPNLDWELRKEFSAGIDALLLNRKLSLAVTYYNSLHDQQRVRAENKYPHTAGLLAYPYTNDNKTLYYGVETAAKYNGKIDDFKYSIGFSATLPRSLRVSYSEPNYTNKELISQGRPVDMIRGYVYDGKFESDEEANTLLQAFDANLQKGDLKYKDVSNDGVIDDNDIKILGNSAPRLFYALNLHFAYRKFELALIADGRSGFDVILNNYYFSSGDGDNNYSKFTKENIGGAYPRLSYYKVNNNFQTSKFWMRKGDYFKVQNIEFAYNLVVPSSLSIGVRHARIFMRGANLLTLSGIKEVDPESIHSGITRYPLNRTITVGAKLTF